MSTRSIITAEQQQIDAKDLIDRLQLAPLRPEGGYLREIFNTCDVTEKRDFSSSHSYYLLESFSTGAFSAWHRLIDTEETLYYHCGRTMNLLLINSKTGIVRILVQQLNLVEWQSEDFLASPEK